MATYTTRLQSVFGPVVERARRWSQSSTTEDRSAATLSDDDHESTTAETAITTPPHSPRSPRSLAPVFESSDIDSGDDASEQTLVVIDPPPGLRSRMPEQPNINENSTSTPSPPPSMSPPEGPAVASSRSREIELPLGRPIPTKSSLLPEDDGQKVLRQKLVEISKLNVSEREKATRMHLLMLEKYNASRLSGNMLDPSSLQSPSRYLVSTEEFHVSKQDNPYKLSPRDIAKTYYTGPNPSPELSVRELGCSHYRRGVKLQCSTCERWHTCRFCHDENEDHALFRRETKNMLCMHCGQAQPVGQDCRFCGIRSARYYCDKCKLWDNDLRKSIYHCNDCGICRIGQGLGKDFFHCKKCGVCMSIALEGSHRCIERSTECDCPICGEYMFTSTLTVVFMKCGHSIHHKCYYEHMKNSYRCPTCARTIINMESQFRALDAEIEAQPLLAPYDKWRCLITCNDCSAKGNVSFHFLGLKCENCKSYNTSQVRILRPEDRVDGARNNIAASTVTPPGPIRTLSSNSLTAQPLNSPPRFARAEAGPADGERTLHNAARALAVAEEAIQTVVELEINHGDEGLMFDDGWETEEDGSDAFSDPGIDEGEELTKASDEEEEEGDDEDDDPIQLIGHR